MLEDQIKNDYIKAMKEKDSFRSQTLSFLRAQLKNHLINNRLEKLEESDVIAVLKKQAKQRRESIKQFEEGGRKDLAENENNELNIIKEYLPEEMSAEELSAIVKNVIEETGASTMKDMGAVMKKVLEKAEGRADNKAVSTLVKESLA